MKLKAVPTVRLGPGWNFVSVPAVLASGADMAGIFAGVDTDGHSIFCDNATSKTWTAMSPSTKVKALDGIWIYVEDGDHGPALVRPEPAGRAARDRTSRPAGTRSATRAFGPQRPTMPSRRSPRNGPRSSGSIEGSQRYETSIFNGGTGDYSDYREMLAGKGYWLYMRESGQISAVGAGP